MYIQDILTSLKVSRSKKGEKKDFFYDEDLYGKEVDEWRTDRS